MATKTNKNSLVAEDETEEEVYPVVYNMYVTTLNITVQDGATLIFQSGRPSDPGKPPGT